jgi:hypothetical protein
MAPQSDRLALVLALRNTRLIRIGNKDRQSSLTRPFTPGEFFTTERRAAPSGKRRTLIARGKAVCCLHAPRHEGNILIGWATILLFGVALVAWPPLGFYIYDLASVPLDLIPGTGLF